MDEDDEYIYDPFEDEMYEDYDLDYEVSLLD